MVTSVYQSARRWPNLHIRLGSLWLRDWRFAGRPAGGAAAPLAAHAPLWIRSGDSIQSHQLGDIRHRHLSVVDAGRTLDLLSAGLDPTLRPCVYVARRRVCRRGASFCEQQLLVVINLAKGS